jgi:2-dehydro-3-deoxyphosphogluconate aldolase / (4S)-4-hydroxy-2-oxoglutarate aldolase
VTSATEAALNAEHQVLESLARARVLPVLTVTDIAAVRATCQALADGGISCVEITYRTALASEAISLASEIPGLTVGAGTVLDPAQLRAAAQAGARFALAPGLAEPVVAAAYETGLPFFPGVATASEVGLARSLGCRVVKIFPASSLGGPAFVRSISAPYPDMRFIPTGGIDEAVIGKYLELPSVVACGASWLCTQDLIDARRFAEITRRAAAMRAVGR